MTDMDSFTGQGTSDFDLIQEIINEHSPAALPRPCSPPANLFLPPPFCQPPRTHPQSSSRSKQPVLVARGTGHQPFLLPSDFKDMASASRASAKSSRHCQGLGLPDLRSSERIASKNRSDTSMLERVLEKPRLVVVEEPKDRGMRFRYECEGRSAGSILGASSTDTNKTQPTIEIQGPIEGIKKVKVTVSLVTKDLPHRPHPHCLVGKDCPVSSGLCVITLNPHTNRRHSFANLGIQCVRRKELDLSLQKRRSQNVDPFQTGHSKGIEDLDMNAVRLCFQCELEWDDGHKDSLSPVVSTTIYDKKATTTSQLKITRLNKYKDSCYGMTEVFMLCDKVQKDDIEIIFRRGSWKANGEFTQTDVHRQIAIVFKTPPYQDQNITEEVDVSVSLRRISDQMESEPVTFTYQPKDLDPYEVKRKFRIKSDISFRGKSCVAAEQHFQNQNAQRSMFPDKRQCSDQLVAHALSETCFHMQQDSSDCTDDTAFVEQLLWDMLANDESLEQELSSLAGMETNLASMDTNFIQNSGMLTQDFCQNNDVQFNKLVNESQTVKSEPQDSVTNALQVKEEETLEDFRGLCELL
ncbi:uncharacterized protein relb isoform X2 [Cynoglossus semilaevis]|uniref:uncharacterized protein relb isoform X2 n=1 Tax=Cynoglossus semilaevis TaxID=244447 RepID=UPI0004971DB2|nr:transcription factor RelB isoform X2 [Cynoglossus semilaevis]